MAYVTDRSRELVFPKQYSMKASDFAKYFQFGDVVGKIFVLPQHKTAGLRPLVFALAEMRRIFTVLDSHSNSCAVVDKFLFQTVVCNILVTILMFLHHI